MVAPDFCRVVPANGNLARRMGGSYRKRSLPGRAYRAREMSDRVSYPEAALYSCIRASLYASLFFVGM